MPEDREEHAIEATKTEARQGTGPRQMVSVLAISIALAVLAGALLIIWFYILPDQPRV
jgi:hypothetical protein